MRSWLTLFIVVFLGCVLTTGVVYAQGGNIGLFADADGADCRVRPNPSTPELVYVYVVHTGAPEGFAAAFSVPVPTCAPGLTWVGDNQAFVHQVVSGASPDGVFVSYNGCKTSPLHILTIVYLLTGSWEPCCRLTVGPHPDWCTQLGTPCGFDCDVNEYPATGGAAILNPNDNCQCAVPVQESSWGRVKALYQ